MKFCLPREWSYDGHVHLSSQNLLLENNLSILSLAYHLISSLMGHLLCIRSVIFFLFFFFFFLFLHMYESIYRGKWNKSVGDG